MGDLDDRFVFVPHGEAPTVYPLGGAFRCSKRAREPRRQHRQLAMVKQDRCRRASLHGRPRAAKIAEPETTEFAGTHAHPAKRQRVEIGGNHVDRLEPDVEAYPRGATPHAASTSRTSMRKDSVSDAGTALDRSTQRALETGAVRNRPWFSRSQLGSSLLRGQYARPSQESIVGTPHATPGRTRRTSRRRA